MLKREMVCLLGLTLCAELALAQTDQSQSTQATPEPVRKIKVLRTPSEVASFYRSSQGVGRGYGVFAYDTRGDIRPTDPYAVASYYRSQPGQRTNPYGYFYASRWNNRRPTAPVGRRAAIGGRGDLCLFAPTFLAPLSSLSASFYGDR